MKNINEFVEENISFITKEQIKKVYDFLGKDCYPLYKIKKPMLLLEMQYDDISYSDIYEVLKDEQFGISLTGASDQLGISKYRIKKLIEGGEFKVIYSRVNRTYGKAIYCDFIRYEDVYNYYLKMNEE